MDDVGLEELAARSAGHRGLGPGVSHEGVEDGVKARLYRPRCTSGGRRAAGVEGDPGGTLCCEGEFLSAHDFRDVDARYLRSRGQEPVAIARVSAPLAAAVKKRD